MAKHVCDPAVNCMCMCGKRAAVKHMCSATVNYVCMSGKRAAVKYMCCPMVNFMCAAIPSWKGLFPIISEALLGTFLFRAEFPWTSSLFGRLALRNDTVKPPGYDAAADQEWRKKCLSEKSRPKKANYQLPDLGDSRRSDDDLRSGDESPA